MDESTSFGSWLKQRRKARDLTQEDLARRIGCARLTLQTLELAERQPSAQDLRVQTPARLCHL